MIKLRRDLLRQRIVENCIPDEDGCWIWQGATSGDGRGGGYGRILVNGHTSAVHRVMATLDHGYIPKQMQVDHLCEKRLCCNPACLEVVQPIVNQRRKKGRQMRLAMGQTLSLLSSNLRSKNG